MISFSLTCGVFDYTPGSGDVDSGLSNPTINSLNPKFISQYG